MNIPQNVGKIDRIIRAIVGIIFIAVGWGIFKNGWLGILFNVLGAILLLNALTGKCLVYKLLKISTLKSSSQTSYTQPPPPNMTQGQ